MRGLVSPFDAFSPFARRSASATDGLAALSPLVLYRPDDGVSFQDTGSATPSGVNDPIRTLVDDTGVATLQSPSDATRLTLRQSGAIFYAESDGATDYVTGTGPSNFVANTALLVSGVFDLSLVGAQGLIWALGADTGTTGGIGGFWSANGIGWHTSAREAVTNSTPSAGWHIISWMKSAGAQMQNYGLWIDGVAQTYTTVTQATYVATAAPSTAAFTLSASVLGTRATVQVKTPCIGFWKSSDDALRQQVEAQLAADYAALGVSL